ncbi:MAG: hypothetical protein PHC64_10785 [Candidatus Gastranaerophilales bacterium]|nr:hypothetical protein [Candidatus Gastranaerophilales bacterium]
MLILKSILSRRGRGVYAFTLAETLIALVIVGVVAMIVVPPLVKNVNEMSWAKAKDNFEAKIDEATKQMNVNGDMPSGNGLSTDTFANVFQQYIKVAKRCVPPDLDNCFVSTFKTSGGTDITTSTDLKTGEDLGHSSYTYDLVGLSLADGTNVIMSFNPSCSYLDWTNTSGTIYSASADTKSYSMGTASSCLSLIYDINGNKGPNIVGKDIGELNAMLSGDDCIQVGSLCVSSSDVSFSPISETPYTENNNYWAGAKKACEDMGWHLPSDAQLAQIVNIYKRNISIKSLLNMSSSYYWTSTQNGLYLAYLWYFPYGSRFSNGKSLVGIPIIKVRCIK